MLKQFSIGTFSPLNFARDPRPALHLLQWVLPFMMLVIVVGYEAWEHAIDRGYPLNNLHLGGEVFAFGILGGLMIFLALRYIYYLLNAQYAARRQLEYLNHELETRITERTSALEQRNQELARAYTDLQQLDQMKSEFVALVSHELRAPLAVFNGGLELAMQSAATLPPATRRKLEVMSRESERLTHFVQTILDLSRLEAGKLSITLGPVAALPLLQRAAAAVLPNGHRPLLWDVPHDLPPLWGDEVYIEEIIRNFARNADKYSPSGRPIRLSANVAENRIHLSVTDEGPGVSPEMQERIFERFYRGTAGKAADAGWGLGLYFARKLAEAQGGRVIVTSPVRPEGDGSQFTLSLPIADGPDESEDV
jgi:signal transduction histidine kinase